MNLRAHTIAALVTIALAAAGCSAESNAASTESSEVNAAPELATDALQGELAKAVDGLWFMSETDAEFDVFVAPGTPGAAVDADAIRAAFSGLDHTTNNYDGTLLKNLASSTTRDFDEWVARDTEIDRDADEDMVAYAKGVSRAAALMKANLTDLTVVYLASEGLSEDYVDVGTIHIFLTGRAKDGSLVALHTIAAWT